MDNRPFGSPAGTVVRKVEIKSDLFTKIGLRNATITAHYVHLDSPKLPKPRDTTLVEQKGAGLPFTSINPQIPQLPSVDEGGYEIPRPRFN